MQLDISSAKRGWTALIAVGKCYRKHVRTPGAVVVGHINDVSESGLAVHLRAACDLAPPGTHQLVVGHATSVDGRPVARMIVILEMAPHRAILEATRDGKVVTVWRFDPASPGHQLAARANDLASSWARDV